MTSSEHWTFGATSLHRIVESEGPLLSPFEIFGDCTQGHLDANRDWLMPRFQDPASGLLTISIQSFLIRRNGLTILVDACSGNDKDRARPQFHRRTWPWLERLREAGVKPEDIDIVLCSHLHVDHVGWNTVLVGGKWVPTFANARYVFGRTEFEHWRDHSHEPAHVAVFGDSVKPIADAGKADLVASDARLADEITLIPTPGHSPGHMSIHIRSDGEEGLLTGDVAHHPCQMAHLGWSSTADSDGKKSAETRRELFSRFADKPVLVIGGHFNAGHIKREGDAFKFIALT
jgi:glyoxylase-like metal-dependent hydrolase (beta-lactamase superfamily II)